ncbi:type I-E CRISPR-associated protein Cas7/Cse4/CasC [Nostocoides jenkinsii]|uniref:CRISPR system CASCADE complex protein CasC n=1 Tax=Nostocoides jenkinsii Ben 74 TaxID=1193518 RepID=A0A077MFQ8_9MICO|nr:type I-E CRISPR-associated protein Cas7/Cse4/CasC [Tetrasphaera jenkinsii]CCI54960.1 CRISPR system CASCADE complex protein CasC [Tetrasphaera jenkinsii Ben 74]
MFVDIHILQSVPPSNINRDDTGSPKTAMYGGVMRARVSSQAWKRAVRKSYETKLDRSEIGVRTKRAVELLVQRIREKDSSLSDDQAQEKATAVVKALGLKVDEKKTRTRQKAIEAGADGPDYAITEYLVFWSNRQLDRLADLALSGDEPITKKRAAEAADEEHGIDVALFGRMVADAAEINVDAAVQVAHAISTHAVTPEQDYFTAVDDQNPDEETGAGMIGTIEFSSATLYRYATVNVAGLRANLGDDVATVKAVEAFVEGLVTSMPTGKQNTFANRTLPDAVLVCLRQDQPVSLVGAYEEPVRSEDGFMRLSAERLATEFAAVAAFLGAPSKVFFARSGERTVALDAVTAPAPLPDVISSVGESVRVSLAPADS